MVSLVYFSENSFRLCLPPSKSFKNLRILTKLRFERFPIFTPDQEKAQQKYHQSSFSYFLRR